MLSWPPAWQFLAALLKETLNFFVFFFYHYTASNACAPLTGASERERRAIAACDAGPRRSPLPKAARPAPWARPLGGAPPAARPPPIRGSPGVILSCGPQPMGLLQPADITQQPVPSSCRALQFLSFFKLKWRPVSCLKEYAALPGGA